MTAETTKSIGESIMQFAQFSMLYPILDHTFAADCAI